jgi:hypothetical protein
MQEIAIMYAAMKMNNNPSETKTNKKGKCLPNTLHVNEASVRIKAISI